MVKIEKKDEVFDQLVGDVTVRHYARSRVVGYLVALNHTPISANWSEILNLDVVISDRSLLFPSYQFEYSSGGARLATPSWWTRSKFQHLHFMVNDKQVNQLQSLLYKKIKIEGDEIALTKKNCGSFFLVDSRVPGWLGLPLDHELVDQTLAAVRLNKTLNRSSCHSIKPHKIKAAGFYNF